MLTTSSLPLTAECQAAAQVLHKCTFAFHASVFPVQVKDKASTMPTGQLKYMCILNFKLWLIFKHPDALQQHKKLDGIMFIGRKKVKVAACLIVGCFPK